MKSRKGFTLIELLVVMAIIALLLSVVMPALRKVKKQARIVICTSYLRQWGTSIHNYASENDEQLLKTVNTWGSGEEGLIAWANDTCNSRASTEFNLSAIGPYLPGFDLANHNLGDIWLCPENNIDYHAMTFEHVEMADFVVMQYSYWARTDLWDEDAATHPKELTGKTFSARGVLMADTCFRLRSTGGYLYNHGKNGPSIHRNPELLGGFIDDGPPEITGLNRCYGDGHAEWRPVEKYYDPVLMNDWDDRAHPRVNSSSVSFY